MLFSLLYVSPISTTTCKQLEWSRFPGSSRTLVIPSIPELDDAMIVMWRELSNSCQAIVISSEMFLAFREDLFGSVQSVQRGALNI